MSVKEKYNHSISLSNEQEQKLQALRQQGYSIARIMDIGMDGILAELLTGKTEDKKA